MCDKAEGHIPTLKYYILPLGTHENNKLRKQVPVQVVSL